VHLPLTQRQSRPSDQTQSEAAVISEHGWGGGGGGGSVQLLVDAFHVHRRWVEHIPATLSHAGVPRAATQAVWFSSSLH
jgi:hypothetical protein